MLLPGCLQKSRISSLSLLQLQEIGLGPPDLPILRDSTHSLRPRDRLHALQHYISAFGYNHIFGYHFNTHKRRPFHQVMNTARDVIRDGLPIKCIEATFLGMLLTCKYPEWQRFPLGFKTKVAGHQHVYRCATVPCCSLLWRCITSAYRRRTCCSEHVRHRSANVHNKLLAFCTAGTLLSRMQGC